MPYLRLVCPLAAHPDPNRFIQYKPNGEPVEKKCDEGLIFSVGQCSCAWKCDKRPSKLGITYYEQNSNNYWLTMVCALGTAFSPATCDCSMHLKINHVNDNPLGQPAENGDSYVISHPGDRDPENEGLRFIRFLRQMQNDTKEGASNVISHPHDPYPVPEYEGLWKLSFD
uniref:Uncharacterized protein n=1 Tax=Magallana gigas TaxID=29159 RepID=K1Q4L4_MAGGI